MSKSIDEICKAMNEEYSIDSMYDDVEYILGLISKYSGKRMAIIDVGTLDPETIIEYERNNLIIPVPTNRRKIKYNLSKQAIFADRMERLYSLLDTFIHERCVIGPKCKITAATLLSLFNSVTCESVNNKVEFPMLMKQYIENNRNFEINKQNTSKGIVYNGITIRSNAIMEHLEVPILATNLQLKVIGK